MTIRLGLMLAPCGWILTPVGAMLKTAQTKSFSSAWLTTQVKVAEYVTSTYNKLEMRACMEAQKQPALLALCARCMHSASK